MSLEFALFVVAALLILSVGASKLSARSGIPALVLFIGIGMLAGSDGPGGIYFDDNDFAQQVGMVALMFILFAGGMEAEWRHIKPAVPISVVLATVGVLVTGGIVGVVAHWVLRLPWLESFLLGSIVASTDAAAVFAQLRGAGLELPEPVPAVLELESGTNDPMAIFLTTSLTALVAGKSLSAGTLALHFVQEMIVGGLGGYLIGRFAVESMRRMRLEYEALYSVLSIAWVLLAYAAPTVLGGNGFLSVYIAGLVYGHGRFHHRRGMRKFHDGVAWLMQIMMFLTLGLLVFPHQLPGIAWGAIVVAAVLIFVARPVAVFASLLPFKMPWNAKAMIAWTGLRGAVPIVLATYPMLADIQHDQLIFNVVFFVVLASSIVQGTSLPWVAKRLGLAG